MKQHYYFDVACVGDSVCIVDSMYCVLRFDVVVDIIFSGHERNEKYIHLKKSKMIIGEKQKSILYHIMNAEQLNSILIQFRDATDENWTAKLPAMLGLENNTPATLPIPNMPQR